MNTSLDIDKIEKRAHREIAAVHDPEVEFHPPWERAVLKRMIAEGEGPAETLALVKEIKDLRKELEELRGQVPTAKA